MRGGSARGATQRLVAGGVVLATGLVLGACRGPDNGQNTLKPEGPAAQKIDDLFVPVFVVSVVIGVLVLGGVVWVALRYRHRAGRDESPKQTHGSTPLEIGWTIAPALILAVVAVFTIRTIFALAEEPGDALKVTAVAKQWWWQFDYPDDKVVTANELVIPTDTEVRVTGTACDDSIPGECNVVHSFWVAQLNGKIDVIPGRENKTTIEADEPGTYLGQCAEYCGLSHANMRFRVIALEPDEFAEWVADQQGGPTVPFDEGPEDLVSKKYQCTNCHTFEDSGLSTYGPNLTHFASRTTFASGYYEVTRERLVEWILDAPSLVPMESRDCRKPGALADPAITCVGMPSFTENTPPGEPVMSREDAGVIADYLLALE